MRSLLKVRLHRYIVLAWIVYLVYSALFGSLLLFPEDSFEILLPAIMQTVVTMVFVKLCNKKYLTTVSLAALTSCLLVIIWHFCLNNGISPNQVEMLFLILPIITTGMTCLVGKIKRVAALSVWKNFRISLLLTYINFIIGFFTFYVFHFWI
ncbi:MAG TPA: hypothetical protein GXX36_04055 [Clostridiaceae bacterium]|nr:hypothetical protein [Clostridiaceae bacterium]